ncbi:hypothetical protein [Parashewanella curva]|uniref:hypothetical protein n=1 Tax=Parashewanella curva TaxID=2338552 RepID=UPI0014048C81|nr:hypothetical protein [Parashewanella curva]
MEKDELDNRKTELEIKKLEQEIEIQRRGEAREYIKLGLQALGILAALIIAWTKLPL